jgi:hypothetical protein
MNKTPVSKIFQYWLTLMEQAYEQLTKEQFRELEEKIRYEINYHRGKKK